MNEVVITAVGIVSPIGIGNEQVWHSIENRTSGVRSVPELVEAGLPVPICGSVVDFEAKQFVKPRKSLKVMSRETQIGFAAAELAWQDAGLEEGNVDPERFGVINGANMFAPETLEMVAAIHACDTQGRFDFTRWGKEGMPEIIPLWLLKFLPNMTPCHIGIFHDARGPTNSIVGGEGSGLCALIEATNVIERGHADLMVAGGNSSRLNLMDLMWHGDVDLTKRVQSPSEAMRPFDANRDGYVNGEGAAMYTLESRQHAEARGAAIIGTIRGYARRSEPSAASQKPSGQSICQSIDASLQSANLTAGDIGHVNAHGLSTPHADRIEAEAICAKLGDVPVTAPKSYFGHLGAGSGAVELAVSLLALRHGKIPPTLNHESPDPACPVNVVSEMQASNQNTVMALNHKSMGQAVALVVESA
ncbi:beta-ketoacyl-[acyl-carrier-protein] synthase family protein [Adhaeretor mobilis]|uniref:3-oxoacyl-[acyl-carrier-protein] synthase 2 n=1 Tax=Adhaeretor mobilis TaxID=1930276 RepID=A0A517MQX8_9BACT|nr:beta-ketoacyl-[acyl-carrier-protein] synthase family protein [Adhaeretor mobilis]QDS97294.1 3-oxoacyl-[acyl-carrier-protein] synthase 2 [Adhaeretor mobilis]